MTTTVTATEPLDRVFILVNGKRASLAKLAVMNQANIKTVNVSGCTALTSLRCDAAKTVYARDCTALTSLRCDAAEQVYTVGCTALTSLKLDAAKDVYARGCIALTSLRCDAAKYVNVSGCTALTDIIDGGRDNRGHHFFGFPIAGHWRIFAGCQNYNVEEARRHWGKGGTSDRADCLALVEKIAAEIAVRETRQ